MRSRFIASSRGRTKTSSCHEEEKMFHPLKRKRKKEVLAFLFFSTVLSISVSIGMVLHFFRALSGLSKRFEDASKLRK
jgi:hypothetical protein